MAFGNYLMAEDLIASGVGGSFLSLICFASMKRNGSESETNKRTNPTIPSLTPHSSLL